MEKLDQLLEELQKAKAKIENPEGISDRGIEVRRADPKVSGIVAHGYGRIMSPEKHGERAKAWAKQDLARLKAQPKPNLTKEEEMEKDSVNPALAPKERKIKDLQAQIDAGTYKPDPKKIAGAMLKEEDCAKFDVQAIDKPPMPSTIHKEMPIKDKEKKQLVDSQGNTIERLEFTKDGQWTLKAK